MLNEKVGFSSGFSAREACNRSFTPLERCVADVLIRYQSCDVLVGWLAGACQSISRAKPTSHLLGPSEVCYTSPPPHSDERSVSAAEANIRTFRCCFVLDRLHADPRCAGLDLANPTARMQTPCRLDVKIMKCSYWLIVARTRTR